MNRLLLFAISLFFASAASAQYEEEERKVAPMDPLKGVEYEIEMQGSLSNGKTPLWLNANKYGLSSLEEGNGYLRGSVARPLKVDEGRKWGIGYGLDLAVAANYTSNLIVQQAFVEGRWLHGTLTIGSKEQPMEMKNNELSSGSQTLGKNARPIPQVRLSLPEYWAVPLTRGWLHLKGHVAYGMMTDKNWQHDFTQQQTRYTDNLLYHSKAGYLKIGNEEVFCPWSLEMGLEMVATFGGTVHNVQVGQDFITIQGGKGIRDFWNAFMPGGAESIETIYQNVEGNQLGSWMARLNYDGDWSSFSIYADKFFEDHSGMLQLDYDGYGTGDEWQAKKDRRYLFYDLKDWMLGMEYNYKPDNWLNTFVFEYLYTKYQSGPIYHDHTQTIADHIGGKDNFYNHYIYPGFQHWGQAIGNPLYRSPIYNEDGNIEFKNNRFMAFHLGLGGHPTEQFNYRVLTTYQEGLGTYDNPYTDIRHNMSILLEGDYHPKSLRHPWLEGTSIKAGYGMDFGSILGGINYGFQLTISKKGVFENRKTKK
ncbi:MAG: hypothetical protein IJV27_06930 [Prevotella sp.]|nr:hypothetical protein [Prevotella sp.]